MTRNEETYREKGRAVFLAAIMVLSVVAMSAAFAGTAAASNHVTGEWDEIPKEDLGGEDIFHGLTLEVSNFSSNEWVQVREGTIQDNEQVDSKQADADGNFSYDTSQLDPGPHVLVDDTGGDTWGVFQVIEQDLTATFNDDKQQEGQVSGVELVIESENRDDFDITIADIDHDDTNTAEIFDGSASHSVTDGVLTIDVDESELEELGVGTHDFTISVDDTTAEASVSFTITAEPPEPDGAVDSFTADDFSQVQGDVMDIGIQIDGDVDAVDEIGVVISEDNYEANVTIHNLDHSDIEDAGGVVTLSWNTHAAGQANDEGGLFNDGDDDEIWSATNADVTVNSETNITDDFRLNTGNYLLSLYGDNGGIDWDNRVDSAPAVIQEQSDVETSVSIAPGATDENELDDVRDAMTESNSVAEEDLLVIEADVDGIFGWAIDASGDIDTGVSLTISQDEAPAYAEAPSFDHDDPSVTYHVLEDENQIVFVIDVEDADLEEGDIQEWDVSFDVEHAFYDDRSDEAAYDVVHRFVELDVIEEPYQVTPTADAVIEGSSSLAPGSSVTATLDKPGVFLDDETVEVDGDRNWVIEKDFSDRSVGDEFTIEVGGTTYDAVFDDTPEADTVTDVEELQEQISDLENEISDLEDQISSLQDDIDQLESDKEQLEDDNEQLQSDLADTQAALNEALSDLSTAESQLTVVQNQLSNAEDEIDDLEAEISDLEDEISDLEGEIDDLESDKEQLESENEELQDTIDANNETIADLNDQLDDRDATIEELEGEISDLEDQLADDDEEDDAEDDGTPGFGVAVALVALLSVAMLALRRQL